MVYDSIDQHNVMKLIEKHQREEFLICIETMKTTTDFKMPSLFESMKDWPLFYNCSHAKKLKIGF